MIPIEKIKVFDPNDIGFDYKTYKKAFTKLKEIKLKAARSLLSLISDKIDNSIIEKNLTLKEYLYKNEGYFDKNLETAVVLFTNGKLHSKYTIENFPTQEKLKEIAKEQNSIPITYSKKFIIEEY